MAINQLTFDGIFSDFFRDAPYRDGSDAYANNHDYYIYFEHVPTNQQVRFKAFITDFDDGLSFSPTKQTDV